jgi:hypothetical protein
MAKHEQIADVLDGKNFQQRLDASPYKYSGGVPLLARATKPAEAVGFWLKDENLKKHLLDKYTECGIGIAVSPKTGLQYYYFVLAAPK